MKPTSNLSKHLLQEVLPAFLFTSLVLVIQPFTVNGQTGTFIPTGSMTTPRFQHTVTPLANGQVLVVGGASATNPFNPVASAELYNPATGAFTATGSMATPRMDHTATLLLNGRVLVAGCAPTNPELYEPATGLFSATASMTTRRCFHAATILPNGKILIVGGIDNTGAPLASAELYDPASGAFTATGLMTTPRVKPDAMLLPNGEVLIAGGAAGIDGSAAILASAEVYDPASGVFTATGSLATARLSPGIAVLHTGKVLFAGGSTGAGGNSAPVATAELYDPTTGTFSPTGSMTTVRSKQTVALLANGQVLVTGGTGLLPFAALSSAELYDPTAGAFLATGSMTIPRFFVTPTAALLPNGRVLIAGGSFNGPVASAELYLGALPPPAPAINSHPALTTNQTSAGFTFTDTQAGVTFVCSLDSSGFTACSSGQTYSGLGQGSHTFSVEAKDSSGNLSTPASFPWTVDTTPPLISGIAAPPANPYGWNNTSVTVSFTCSVSVTFPGIGIASCAGPTTLTAQGAGLSVTGTAVDNAGNTAQASVAVNIDETNPTVTYAGNAGTYTVDQTVAITCTAADALSGVAGTTCANINGAAYSFGLGPHSYNAAATDKAGNVGNGSTSFTVQVTSAGLGNLVTQFVGNPGIASALSSKLSAAQAAAVRGDVTALDGQLGAFINQVSAQSGKSLSATQAAILIQLASALMM
jgi:hypothetical protein